jgi:putative intracellular protease/amidase
VYVFESLRFEGQPAMARQRGSAGGWSVDVDDRRTATGADYDDSAFSRRSVSAPVDHHLTTYCQYDSMLLMTTTAHLALYNTLADWEVGHLLVELRTGRFTGTPWEIVTVAESSTPITTMGGLRVLPDMLLDDLHPASSGLLILPGADMWDAGRGQAFAAAAARFLEAGVPVAAICGATAGLARAGLLDERRHTSAAAEYLSATGYAGGNYYLSERAVVDRDLITAGPQSPVQFARATLSRLGLASERTLEAYEALFHRADPTAFPVLMQAQHAA